VRWSKLKNKEGPRRRKESWKKKEKDWKKKDKENIIFNKNISKDSNDLGRLLSTSTKK
jgi:hypothetical protein